MDGIHGRCRGRPQKEREWLDENVEYSFPPLDASNTTDDLRDQMHHRITHLFYVPVHHAHVRDELMNQSLNDERQ
jgi:hypothetical protein